MRESDIEDYLIKCVKEAKGEVRKVKWIGRRGAPDRLVLMERFACFVELKAPGQKPTAAQLREHARLRRSNIPVAVIDSFFKVEELVYGHRHG